MYRDRNMYRERNNDVDEEDTSPIVEQNVVEKIVAPAAYVIAPAPYVIAPAVAPIASVAPNVSPINSIEERLSNLEKSERYKQIFEHKDINGPDFNKTEILLKNLKTLCLLEVGQKLYVNTDIISTSHPILEKITSTPDVIDTPKEDVTEKDVSEKEKEDVTDKNPSEKKILKLDSLVRWYYSESRDKTYQKIKSIIKDTIICGYLAIESNNLVYSDSKIKYKTVDDFGNLLYIKRWEIVRDTTIAKTNKEVIEKIIMDFTFLEKGLNNLKETYKDDISFKTKIDVEILIIKDAVKEFKDYLDIYEKTV